MTLTKRQNEFLSLVRASKFGYIQIDGQRQLSIAQKLVEKGYCEITTREIWADKWITILKEKED